MLRTSDFSRTSVINCTFKNSFKFPLIAVWKSEYEIKIFYIAIFRRDWLVDHPNHPKAEEEEEREGHGRPQAESKSCSHFGSSRCWDSNVLTEDVLHHTLRKKTRQMKTEHKTLKLKISLTKHPINYNTKNQISRWLSLIRFKKLKKYLKVDAHKFLYFTLQKALKSPVICEIIFKKKKAINLQMKNDSLKMFNIMKGTKAVRV